MSCKELDVIEDIPLCFTTVVICFAVNPLPLQQLKEAFRNSIQSSLVYWLPDPNESAPFVYTKQASAKYLESALW